MRCRSTEFVVGLDRRRQTPCMTIVHDPNFGRNEHINGPMAEHHSLLSKANPRKRA